MRRLRFVCSDIKKKHPEIRMLYAQMERFEKLASHSEAE